MSNNHAVIKQTVLDAVRKHAAQINVQQPQTSYGVQALGEYIQDCLQKRGMGRVAFAQALDMEIELADAILEGLLPASELHTQLLQELATVLNCDFHRLELIVSSNGSNKRINHLSSV